MRGPGSSLLVAVLMLLPASLFAQTTAETDAKGPSPAPVVQTGNDIVVTGRKGVEARDALAFARSASAPIDGQLAKFNIAVCPMAIGFPAAMGAQIVSRMRDVATAAGAKLEKPGCKGNMVVVAAKDGLEMVREMRRLHTPLIDGLGPHDFNAVVATQGPVRSWCLTRVENAFGDPAVNSGDGSARTMEVYSGSNINPPTQQSIGLAVVVIEWSAMEGKTTIQIADYAAMRTLAKTNPAKAGGVVQTSLALFDAGAKAPPELSAADLAYLQGLYTLPGARRADFQVGQISNGVKKASQAEP